MADPIVWIDEVSPIVAAKLAGAKMGRLSELHNAGIRVPLGFTVTVDAYRRHCAESDVDMAIEHALSNSDMAQAAATIRETFLNRTLPEPLAESITGGYRRLAERLGVARPRTAVRSSATGEDGADASFAGIFDSYLGVTGTDAVLNAVRDCWSSLFTDRALAYRLRNGISHHDMPIAVGVTELIDARASGVAFSVHPVTGKNDRIVIEANWGWGESVVQGLVTPDRAEVGKSDQRILRYTTNTKTTLSTFDADIGRVVEAEMPAELVHTPALNDEQVLAISEAVHAIEQHYGYPVDVEWVVATAGTVYVVQARPITVTATTQETTEWNPVAAANRYAFGGS